MARARIALRESIRADVEAARRSLLGAYNALEGAPRVSLDRIIARLESWQRGNGGES